MCVDGRTGPSSFVSLGASSGRVEIRCPLYTTHTLCTPLFMGIAKSPRLIGLDSHSLRMEEKLFLPFSPIKLVSSISARCAKREGGILLEVSPKIEETVVR